MQKRCSLVSDNAEVEALKTLGGMCYALQGGESQGVSPVSAAKRCMQSCAANHSLRLTQVDR